MAAVTLTAILGSDEATDAMTERILDAAYASVLDFGVRHLSVEDVARRLGIARITIYRRFATRDELLRAVLLREGRRLFALVDAAIAGHEEPEAQLVEGFVATLAAVRGHELVQRTLAREPDMLASLLITQGGPVIALAREYLAGHVRRGQRAGQLRAFDAQGVAELAVRLSLSFLLTPESCIPLDDDGATRAFARSYLVPALRSLSSSRKGRR